MYVCDAGITNISNNCTKMLLPTVRVTTEVLGHFLPVFADLTAIYFFKYFSERSRVFFSFDASRCANLTSTEFSMNSAPNASLATRGPVRY